MEKFSEFFAERLKAFFATLIVGMLPQLISAVEKATGFDIPGQWETSFTTWVLAILAGIGVNYTVNVKKA